MVSWWEKGPARRRTVLASLGTACVGGAIINGGIAKGDNMASIVMAGLGTAMFLGIVEPRGNEPPLDEVEKRIRENSLDFWQQEIRHRGLHRRLFIPPALTVIEEGELVEKPITFRKPFWTQADFAAKIGALLTEQEVRRAVVYGRGGSGKSLLAMMGMIGMMERPDEGAPVPLLLSLSSWRSTETFESWINRYLVSTYPATRLLSGEGDGGRIGRLARCGRFMIVLDGFDELPRGFHAEASGRSTTCYPRPTRWSC